MDIDPGSLERLSVKPPAPILFTAARSFSERSRNIHLRETFRQPSVSPAATYARCTERMTEMLPTARVRTDVVALVLAAAIGVITLLVVLAVELISSAQTSSTSVSAASLASTSGFDALLPFLAALAIALIAGAAVVIGRRLSK